MKYRREPEPRGERGTQAPESSRPAPSRPDPSPTGPSPPGGSCPPDPRPPLRPLRRRFLVASAVAAAGAAILGAVTAGLPDAPAFPGAAPVSFPGAAFPVAAGLAALVAVLLLAAVVRRALPELRRHRKDGESPGRLGPAVPLTLLRLALVSALGGYALTLPLAPERAAAGAVLLPFALYLPAVLADALDGVVARRRGFATGFGALLDRETDALGLAAASLTAVLATGALPAWYLLAGFARYLCALGLSVEERRGRTRRDLDPSPFRRRLAGFQMALAAASLAPVPPFGLPDRWAHPAALALGAPFLLGFARDYLVLSGRLDPEGARWRALAGFLARRRRFAFGTGAAAAAALGALALFGLPGLTGPAGSGLGPPALAAAALTALLAPPRRPGTAARGSAETAPADDPA